MILHSGWGGGGHWHGGAIRQGEGGDGISGAGAEEFQESKRACFAFNREGMDGPGPREDDRVPSVGATNRTSL